MKIVPNPRTIGKTDLTAAEIRKVKKLRLEGLSVADIAKMIGCGENFLRKLMQKAGIPTGKSRKGVELDDAPVKLGPTPEHLKNFNLVRRGFHVPDEKRERYFQLLKQGVPIKEAAKMIGAKEKQK